MKNYIKILYVLTGLLVSCGPNLPLISPDVITQQTKNDTDDPAIWVNRDNTEKSIVFGTDKDTDGAIYAFDLEGKVIEQMTIRDLRRPNNVDVGYDVRINDNKVTDILIFTERERQQVRIFSVPDMQPLDNGGYKVFEDTPDNEMNLPMGISLYQSPESGKTYAIVGRKNGPPTDYLHQFELAPGGDHLEFNKVREFGNFSGKKEIEAIAVDHQQGYIYYSDEQRGLRKYYAEPSKGDEELAHFGQETFKRDNEGIAIAAFEDGSGYVIVSDQQRDTFNFFSRDENNFLFAKNLGTDSTDGIEVYTGYLSPQFPNGLFVVMNEDRNFFYYDLARILNHSED